MALVITTYFEDFHDTTALSNVNTYLLVHFESFILDVHFPIQFTSKDNKKRIFKRRFGKENKGMI